MDSTKRRSTPYLGSRALPRDFLHSWSARYIVPGTWEYLPALRQLQRPSLAHATVVTTSKEQSFQPPAHDSFCGGENLPSSTLQREISRRQVLCSIRLDSAQPDSLLSAQTSPTQSPTRTTAHLESWSRQESRASNKLPHSTAASDFAVPAPRWTTFRFEVLHPTRRRSHPATATWCTYCSR